MIRDPDHLLAPDRSAEVTPPTAVAAAETPPASAIVEALLFATDSPVAASKIAQVAGELSVAEVKKYIEALNARYESNASAFRIVEVAKGFQMLTLPQFNPWLNKLLSVRRETKLSSASLETLAVVAYKQPVTRAKIEEIRGVAAGEMLQRLREANLIKIVGRAEELGRPLLYGTTRKFLEVFGLVSLADLPTVEALAPPAEQKKAGKERANRLDSTASDTSSDPHSPAGRTLADVAEAVRKQGETVS